VADFAGFLSAGLVLLASDYPGRVSAAHTHTRHTYLPSLLGILALSQGGGVLLASGVIPGGLTLPALPRNDHGGHRDDRQNGGDIWFEHVHVIQRSYAFGNILTTITTTIEPYNAYRSARRILSAVVNNVGIGIELPNLPVLPEIVPPQSSMLVGPTITFSPSPPTLDSVVRLTLRATIEGVASFDSTIDFLWDLGTTRVDVSGQRVVFLSTEFDGVEEHLEFLTDVISKRAGKEQRKSPRVHPRQAFRVRHLLSDRDRREMHSILFDWQARSFGLPLWHEGIRTTAAVSIGATNVPVISTSFIDFRVGKLAAIFTDSRTHDVLAITVVNATSLDFLTPTANAYPAGTLVMPVRTVQTVPVIQGSRFPVTLDGFDIEFECTDNVVIGLADVSAFSTYNGKVFLDDSNLMRGTSPHSYFRPMRRIDNETGTLTQTSTWDRSKRGHQKTFHPTTRQALWNLRRLMYALRGRQVSFYIPTFIEDLVITQPITAATAVLTIELIGYAKFVRSRSPRDTIRVTFTDGTKLIRVVTAAVEVSTTEEQLTVNANWPDNRTVAEITRVEFIELVRLDTDDVTFDHEGVGRARCTVPLQAVLT